jgi:hypothetical protein
MPYDADDPASWLSKRAPVLHTRIVLRVLYEFPTPRFAQSAAKGGNGNQAAGPSDA